MVLKTNEAIFNSKRVARYEEIARKAVFGYDQLFTMALSILEVNHNEAANVLVVGCGSGMELTTFGNIMPNWRITGVDPSAKMIQLAKTKIDEYNLNERILLYQGYVEGLPEKETYDYSTLIFVLRFIPETKDKISLLNNISKRLKPGAKLIIIDQYGDPNNEAFINMSNSWKNFMKYEGASPELVEKIFNQAGEHSLINEQELLEILSESGFEKLNRFYNSFIHGGWIVQKKY
jgi:tRNA (cmo5U34)-methyltransferase